MDGMAAAALFATLALSWAAVGRLAPDYASAFASLGETPVPRIDRRERAGRSPGPRAASPILKAWMPDPVERGAFRLATAYMRRDRDLRMRLYPSIATILVFAILPFFDKKFGRAGPVLVLTFIGMQTTAAMTTLKMSPQFAASDVFRYAPLRGTAPVFHGVRKAVMVGFVLPIFLLVMPILFFAIRARETLLTVLPVLAAVPTLSLLGGLAGDYLPFSLPPILGRQGMTNVGLIIAGSLGSATIAAVALLALRFGWFWPLLAGEIVALSLLHAVLLKGIRARSLRALE